MNAYIVRSHGSTPFAVMFGRKQSPLTSYTQIEANKITSKDIAAWQKNRRNIHDLIYQALCEKISAHKRKSTLYHDRRKQIVPTLIPGQFVLLREMILNSKWAPKASGPFKVQRQTKGGSYILLDLDTNETPLARHYPISQLIKIPTPLNFNLPSFDINGILDDRGTGEDQEFFISWKHTSERTWIPRADILSSRAVDTYWRTKQMTRSKLAGGNVGKHSLPPILATAPEPTKRKPGRPRKEVFQEAERSHKAGATLHM